MKKAEREHLSRVAALGCIVCRNLGFGETPAEIHHIRTGQGVAQRADNYSAIPLCPPHHRTGGHGVAVHAGKQTWERNFGTELELLEQVNNELGVSV
ncbi:Ref family recombination enhancement nuclease [Cedecea sp. MMO-103]|uniref:Ref family recombination enhancement nuclease n=1 Tax=Cedecea sp. MMO-103 TaxID=3081238 RepID=UPI0030198746